MRRITGIVRDSAVPLVAAVDGVRIVIRCVVDDIKNLVGGIGLVCKGIINGNTAGCCIISKGCDGQGEDHDQGQQEAGEFSGVFHVLCSFFHRNFELEWWLSAYQEDASSSFRRLQWLYNRVAAPKISARPPAV